MAIPLAQSTSTSMADFASVSDKEKESRKASSRVSIPDVEKAVSIEDAAPDASTSQPDPASQMSNLKWVMIAMATYTVSFLYGLDTTIVADVQGAVISSFGEVEKLGWLGIGFPLGSIAMILSFSKAFSIFDVKWLFVGSTIMFEAGSALCGGAPSMNAFIVGRVWAGAGGAGMYLGLLNIFSIYTTIQKRSLYMSGCGVIWGIGCILGPVIGGSFADSSATWRWSFYINLVLFGLFSPVYFFIMPSYMPQPGVPLGTRLKHVDWLGVVLNAGLYITFVMAFTFGGTLWAWNDGRTIAVFVVFGVILLAFIATQYFSFITTPQDRLFPGDFLRRRSLVLLYIVTACSSTAFFIPIYYIPIFFQFTRGDNGVDAAVRLLPFVIISILFIILNGVLMPKGGYYMPWYFVSSVLTIIGGALMYSTVAPDSPASQIYGYSVLIATGAGMIQQAAYSIASAKVQPNRVPDAVGFINAAQIGTIVIALTITSTVFQNIGFKRVQAALQGLDFSAADIHAALSGARSAVFTSNQVTAEVRGKVIEGIVDAINDGYILVIVAGILALVASLFMKRERLFMEVGVAGG